MAENARICALGSATLLALDSLACFHCIEHANSSSINSLTKVYWMVRYVSGARHARKSPDVMDIDHRARPLSLRWAHEHAPKRSRRQVIAETRCLRGRILLARSVLASAASRCSSFVLCILHCALTCVIMVRRVWLFIRVAFRCCLESIRQMRVNGMVPNDETPT